MVPKPRMKPRFTIHLKDDDGLVMERLDKILHSERTPVTGKVLKNHAFVQLPEEKRSLLSPYLNLTLHEDQSQTTLDGRFSPHPHVWTGFMAIYGALGFIGMAGLVYGWAQSLIGESAVVAWLAPISLGVGFFVYGAAVIGQGLTADEMYTLRKAVDRAVENCDKKPEETKATS